MSARILVVDDNPINVKLLEARLTHDYFIVTSAANGREAFEKAKAEQPDLILLDVMMPEMDGFEACRCIKMHYDTRHIPVVMVTALSDTEDRLKGLEVGADDFLSKPINETALMARVRSLLRLKMMMDEWRMREATATKFSLAQAQQYENSDETSSELDEDADILDGTVNKILICPGYISDEKLFVEALQAIGFEIKVMDSQQATINEAQIGGCDLVIAGMGVDGEAGFSLCSLLRADVATRYLPILLVAENTEMPLVIKGLELGATDYILRPIEKNEMVARVRTQLRHKKQYDRMRGNYERSLTLALVDQLTGAFNRRYLDSHFPRVFERCRRSRHDISALLIDVDHFKNINDEYGHQAGDEVLREMIKRIAANIRPFDLLARIGGEEFLIILPQTETVMACKLAERLRNMIASKSLKLDEGQIVINFTVSIGVSTMLSDPAVDSPKEMTKRADTALYRAKNEGRNRVVVYDDAVDIKG